MNNLLGPTGTADKVMSTQRACMVQEHKKVPNSKHKVLQGGKNREQNTT